MSLNSTSQLKIYFDLAYRWYSLSRSFTCHSHTLVELKQFLRWSLKEISVDARVKIKVIQLSTWEDKIRWHHRKGYECPSHHLLNFALLQVRRRERERFQNSYFGWSCKNLKWLITFHSMVFVRLLLVHHSGLMLPQKSANWIIDY